MNILPKKRWHVRTKDNIARVRKDEAAAQEELRKKQEKLNLAESEARVNFLRKRFGLPEKQQKESTEDKLIDEEACSSHVNLFVDYKSHIKTANKELEKEKKDEQEKYEKKIGYLTYLGQDTNEALRLKSWYEVAPKRLDVGSEREAINEKDLKTKHNHDPLTLLHAILQPDSKSVEPSTSFKLKSSPCNELTKNKEIHSESSKRHKKERKNQKKEKRLKGHRHKKEKRKEKNVEEQVKKRLKLEELRKERLQRETIERARQKAVLAPKESKKAIEITNSSAPKIVQKYNSQFNPELAKQNIN